MASSIGVTMKAGRTDLMRMRSGQDRLAALQK